MRERGITIDRLCFQKEGVSGDEKDISNNINYARDELYKWTEKEEADEAWATIKAKSERSSKRHRSS